MGNFSTKAILSVGTNISVVVTAIALASVLSVALALMVGMRRKKKRRHHHHRPLNPTLAQTGGLPPLREKENSPPPQL
jgi:hypothetical protein